MYERRHQHPLSRRAFALRLLAHAVAGVGLVGVSLGAGMAGYMRWEHLDRRVAFLNAAMLLGGMGPVNTPSTPEGQLFAGWYALYAGLVFLVVTALLLTPILHRLLHTFHWVEDADAGAERAARAHIEHVEGAPRKRPSQS